MTHIKNTTRTHVSAAQIDWCVIMALRAHREMYVVCMFVCVCVCVCVSVCMERYSAAETKPPNPDAPTSSGPPNAMQGYDAPSPGSVLSSCRMLLFFVCLTEWLAGLLTDWKSERVRACFCAISKPPAPLVYPQLKASLSSQHQHPTPPTRPRPASWLCGILATANGVPMESPCRAACWLDNRIPSNEDDGNDFTPSLPSPSAAAWILNFFKDA